jgi:hypothetical protein
MKATRFLAAATALLFGAGLSAFADEGMWMIHAIDAALEKKMQERGLELSAREIYNADAPGTTVADAVISFGFYCTASLVSDEGLMITNHHCAYSDVSAMSTADHNYLEEGFWAFHRQDERPIPGKKVYFLKRVLDVTDEVEALKRELEAKGERYGMRRLNHIMTQRYRQEKGYESSLESMWSGEKYYITIYKTYTDVRLVAAPPVAIAAFGGDEDNWEWPQHKADFALYRIYDHGEPLKSPARLRISTAGLRDGDFTMVIGYPGRTDRYSSAAKVAHAVGVERPVTNSIRKEQMELVRKAMDADPEVRRKYSDWFFSLSNIQEMQEGEVQCIKRFRVIDEKRALEKELQEWIDADPARQARWGTLLPALDAEYAATDDIERQKAWYRETLVRGTRIAPTMLRMANDKGGRREELLRRGRQEIDPAVEQALLALALDRYFAQVDTCFTGEKQKALRARFTEAGRTDYPALAAWLWDHPDEMVDCYTEVKITAFNEAENHLSDLSHLHHEYTHALYEMRAEKGIPQYPDANSTMRITYGRVCGLEPWDAVVCAPRSTVAGLLEKNDPARHDFALPGDFLSLLQTTAAGDRGVFLTPPASGPLPSAWVHVCENTPVSGPLPISINFLTDNDITGGNSGSPVLNARGELVGLAFDGNKESLASNFSATEGYNKCVCVDIRYVLWVLREYARLDRVVAEMGVS